MIISRHFSENSNRSCLLKNIALLAAICALMMIVSEIAVRTLFPQGAILHPKGLFTSHSIAGCYGFTPGFHGYTYDPDGKRTIDVRINRFGFRGAEPGKKSRYRILILGDSFTAALNCQLGERFAERMMAIGDSLDFQVEALAVGVPGYCAREQYMFLEALGDSLQPDCIILQLYPGNDLAEAALVSDYRVIDGYLVDTSRKHERVGWRHSLFRWVAVRSHFARMIYRTVRDRFGSKPASEGKNREDNSGKINQHSFYAAQFSKGMDDPAVRKGWEKLKGYVSNISEWAVSRNIPIIGFTVPDRMQFSRPEWEVFCTRTNLNPDSISVDRCYNQGRSVFDSTGVEYLDLAVLFRLETDPLQLYGVRDAHLSPAGHDLVGNKLFNEIGGCIIKQAKIPPLL